MCDNDKSHQLNNILSKKIVFLFLFVGLLYCLIAGERELRMYRDSPLPHKFCPHQHNILESPDTKITNCINCTEMSSKVGRRKKQTEHCKEQQDVVFKRKAVLVKYQIYTVILLFFSCSLYLS